HALTSSRLFTQPFILSPTLNDPNLPVNPGNRDHPDSVIVGVSGFVRPVRLEVLMNPNLRRWMALVVVCFGQLMIMLDTTIVNVALPYIQRDLRFSQADLTWVVNASLIAFGGFLLLAGRIGDLTGRRTAFLPG